MNCPCCGQPFPEEMAETKQPPAEPVESDYDAGRRLVAEIKASDSYRRRMDQRGYAVFDRPYWEPSYAKRPNVGNHKPPAPGSVMPTTTARPYRDDDFQDRIQSTLAGLAAEPSGISGGLRGGGSFGGAGATGEW